MNSSSIPRRDLESARRELVDAAEHLSHTQYGYDTQGEMRRAVEAVIRAVGSVAVSVERLAELPECDHQCQCAA